MNCVVYSSVSHRLLKQKLIYFAINYDNESEKKFLLHYFQHSI